MGGQSFSYLQIWHRILLLGGLLATLVICTANGLSAQEPKLEALRIGTSGMLTSDKSGDKEKTALDSLRDFIKSETGLNNDILKQKNWQTLAKFMADGKTQLGVFQGYEYAWVQEKYPSIKPLALAVNVNRYPTVYVIAKKDDSAKDFPGLQGQTLCLPANAPRFVNFYLTRQTQAAGKKLDTFFSKITSQNDPIDAIDDVVDGVAQVTAIDQATLEVYKKQKPGRFKQLKEIAHSQPMPPVVIAYVDKSLSDTTLQRFRDGLLNANHKDRGQTMLNTFGLTGFETIPADFEQVLAATRKAYPPEDTGDK